MTIAEKIKKVKDGLPPHVTLIAVSKTQPLTVIQELYEAGYKTFGENKVQELLSKQSHLPSDIEWHLIGHLQTNKVKYIVPFIRLIHSVDSLKLLKEINKEAFKCNRIIDCLLQVYIAKEETKYGLDREEIYQILQSNEFKELYNVKITGVMGMATFTNDTETIRAEFRELKLIFEELKQHFFADKPYFKEISAGMSGDYMIAVEEGSTMVRLGTTIFGERNYLIKN